MHPVRSQALEFTREDMQGELPGALQSSPLTHCLVLHA